MNSFTLCLFQVINNQWQAFSAKNETQQETKGAGPSNSSESLCEYHEYSLPQRVRNVRSLIWPQFQLCVSNKKH